MRSPRLWKRTDRGGRKSIPYRTLQSFVAEQRDLIVRSVTRAVISTHLLRSTMLPSTSRSPPVALRSCTWTLPVCFGDDVFLCARIHDDAQIVLFVLVHRVFSRCANCHCPHIMNFFPQIFLRIFGFASTAGALAVDLQT